MGVMSLVSTLNRVVSFLVQCFFRHMFSFSTRDVITLAQPKEAGEKPEEWYMYKMFEHVWEIIQV